MERPRATATARQEALERVDGATGLVAGGLAAQMTLALRFIKSP